MAIIVTARGLRYSIFLHDDEVRIKENANFFENAENVIKKINIFKKDKILLTDESYKLDEIKKAKIDSLTIDASIFTLELCEGSIKKYEISPTDKNTSNALKTHVKQIADYINSRKDE